MAAQTKQNARAINANMNQDYVNWLQHQPLPNSPGAMGIHEAETILAARSDLNHQYQQRFIEEKTRAQGATSSPIPPISNVISTYDQTHIQNEVSAGSMATVSQIAAGAGFSPQVDVRSPAQKTVAEKLSQLQDQLADQTELMEKQIRVKEAEHKS